MQYKLTLFSLLASVSLSFHSTSALAQNNNLSTPQPLPTNSNPTKDTVAMGVAISPGKLLFTCKPGSTQSQVVTLTNHTNFTYNFRTGFTDYDQNNSGKPQFQVENSKKGKYALSKWANVSPSFFTLEPGKVQKITVTVTLPNSDSSRVAAWTVMEVDQVKKKEPIPEQNGGQTMSLGINPEIGLGVYIYQNPPNVIVNNVDITHFSYRDTLFILANHKVPSKQLWLQATNVGDGISFCTSYAEITNTKTGKSTRLNTQQFTILPSYSRDFIYELPKDIEPGDYSAVGIVDFGNKTPKKVAQLNFSITH